MSAGHDEHGHEDLEKIIKLTDAVQGIPHTKEMVDFRDEAYIKTADLFKQHRRQKLTGTALDAATNSLFSNIAKQVFVNEVEDGASKYERFMELGVLKEKRTGTQSHYLDREVSHLSGITKSFIQSMLREGELSPDMMTALSNQLYQKYVQQSIGRQVQAVIKTNEDMAQALKYLTEVQKEPGAPDKLKQMEIPVFSKSALRLDEGQQIYMNALGALGSYAPQIGKAAHGAAHH